MLRRRKMSRGRTPLGILVAQLEAERAGMVKRGHGELVQFVQAAISARRGRGAKSPLASAMRSHHARINVLKYAGGVAGCDRRAVNTVLERMAEGGYTADRRTVAKALAGKGTSVQDARNRHVSLPVQSQHPAGE